MYNNLLKILNLYMILLKYKLLEVLYYPQGILSQCFFRMKIPLYSFINFMNKLKLLLKD